MPLKLPSMLSLKSPTSIISSPLDLHSCRYYTRKSFLKALLGLQSLVFKCVTWLICLLICRCTCPGLRGNVHHLIHRYYRQVESFFTAKSLAYPPSQRILVWCVDATRNIITYGQVESAAWFIPITECGGFDPATSLDRDKCCRAVLYRMLRTSDCVVSTICSCPHMILTWSLLAMEHSVSNWPPRLSSAMPLRFSEY